MVVFVAGRQQSVLAKESVEGGLSDATPLQQPVLDAEPVQGDLAHPFVVAEVRPGGIHRFEQFFGRDLSRLALVFASFVGHPRDAVVFVTVEPGLYRAPGELTRVPLFVVKRHGGDIFDALVAGSAFHGVDGTQDPHLQVNGRLFHESSPDS